MEIEAIRTEEQHSAVLEEIERLWHAPPGTPEHDRMEVLARLVEDYEEKHHPLSSSASPPTLIAC
jgi:HTH-type transcriptional regulator / antitoxin HigA